MKKCCMDNFGNIDILENELVRKYPNVLDILLRDHTTQKNIFWATDNYAHLGKSYTFHAEISAQSITGDNGHIIMPRVKKDTSIQKVRSKDMAEVFTPSWVCNAQNNLIDGAWFGRENVFNTEIHHANGSKTWKVNTENIAFTGDKTWKHYVRDTRLEITCGEAPYITSRYDTTTGEYIPIENRIGLLDRKLRVIHENTTHSTEWLKATQIAYKNTYAFEWQGDSLLLAREAMLMTFIENYVFKFHKEPLQKSIDYIAYIISWNVWQMDGIKGVIPNSCKNNIQKTTDLFGEVLNIDSGCLGCNKNIIHKHNGVYALIKDWSAKDPKAKKIRYIDLIKHSTA